MLQDLVMGYNRLYHHSIKMAPNKVAASNQEEVRNNLYAKMFECQTPQAKV